MTQQKGFSIFIKIWQQLVSLQRSIMAKARNPSYYWHDFTRKN